MSRSVILCLFAFFHAALYCEAFQSLFIKNSCSISTSSLFAGGFGSVGKGKKNGSGKKIRKVSGHSGSGSKPLRIAANTFDKIHEEFGSESVNDLYVRSLDNDESTFWFVGKSARKLKGQTGESVPTAHEAVISQKRLILEYAKTLRPQNLGGPFSKRLEVWIAPGNSEMDTAQNKVALEKVGGGVSDIPDTFLVSNVGYNPEIYVGDEVKDGGLRVKRDSEGRPLKAAFEINASA